MTPYDYYGKPIRLSRSAQSNTIILEHQVRGLVRAIHEAVKVLQDAPVGTLERWHARGPLREALGNHHTFTEHLPYDQRMALRAEVAEASRIMAEAWRDKATDAAYAEHSRNELIAWYDKRAAEDRQRFLREITSPSMYEHHVPRC